LQYFKKYYPTRESRSILLCKIVLLHKIVQNQTAHFTCYLGKFRKFNRRLFSGFRRFEQKILPESNALCLRCSIDSCWNKCRPHCWLLRQTTKDTICGGRCRVFLQIWKQRECKICISDVLDKLTHYEL